MDFVGRALENINIKGHGDSIMTVFTVPAIACVDYQGFIGVDDTPTTKVTLKKLLTDKRFTEWYVRSYTAPPYVKQMGNAPHNHDGVNIRNKKLLTYPYSYLTFNPPFR